jgi:hypothetical protein
MIGIGISITRGGLNASHFASRPAPSGFRWDFVTQNGQTVTQNGAPVVDLVRIA